MKKLIKSLIAATVLAGAGISTANAAVIVDFQVLHYPGSTPGQFEGADSNANNTLSFNELTSFSFSNPGNGHFLTLASLSGFGDFNYLTNTWTPNGAGWGDNGAYFSWNAEGNAIHGSWAIVSTSVASITDVPEPASLAILGLGLAGLAAARRRTK